MNFEFRLEEALQEALQEAYGQPRSLRHRRYHAAPGTLAAYSKKLSEPEPEPPAEFDPEIFDVSRSDDLNLEPMKPGSGLKQEPKREQPPFDPGIDHDDDPRIRHIKKLLAQRYPYHRFDIKQDEGGKFNVRFRTMQFPATNEPLYTSDLFQVSHCADCDRKAKAAKKAAKQQELLAAREMLQNLKK